MADDHAAEDHVPSDYPDFAPVRWYLKIFEYLGGGLLGITLCVMVTQVFMRYFLNASLIWAEELCRYLLIWISFLLAGPSIYRGQMIAVNTVLGALPRIPRIIVRAVFTIPVVIFLCAIAYYAYIFAGRLSMQKIPAFDFIWGSIFGEGEKIGISIYWVYLTVALGLVLTAIHLVADVWLEFRRESSVPRATLGS